MMHRTRVVTIQRTGRVVLSAVLAVGFLAASRPAATRAAQVYHPDLSIETVVSAGLSDPAQMAFIGPDDFLVTEQATGKVRRVIGGVLQAGQVLDLPVSTGLEPGLHGIVVDRDFSSNHYVFLFYTRSATGADGGARLENRISRFVWDGANLTGELILHTLPAGNSSHHGGVLAVGQDATIYAIMGNQHSVEQTTNLPSGALREIGCVVRMNRDGTPPGDNPLAATPGWGFIYAYGMRNSYGIGIDPLNGRLWQSENGEPGIEEVNLLLPGTNSGWQDVFGIVPTPVAGLTEVPGSFYSNPEFEFDVTAAPTAVAFQPTPSLGPDLQNDMFVGEGHFDANHRIFHFELNAARDGLSFAAPALQDLKGASYAEMTPIIFADGFGIITDIEFGPDGFMYVIDRNASTIFRIVGNFDCNHNGLTDACDLNCGPAGGGCDLPGCGAIGDCNANTTPDDCEPDCNRNGAADACDISGGTSQDADADGKPDECAILRVKSDAVGAGDGLTWADAIPSVYEALAIAGLPANGVKEIWVASGVYKPDTDGLTNPRLATFTMLSGVALYGGFVGTETQRIQRDPRANVTTLSGDLSGNDGPSFAGAAENCYQVIRAVGVNNTAVIDGFTVTGGNANLQPNNYQGGGLYADNGGPTIANCTFIANQATWGGAMYLRGIFGARIVSCRFLGNRGTSIAGAVSIVQANPTFINGAFTGNTAATNGGAMFNNAGSPVLLNCTFSGNTAATSGGAILTSGGSVVVTNGILWGNSDSGGADESGQVHVASGTPIVRSTIVQGLATLTSPTNLGLDPLFFDADGADNQFGTLDDDVRFSGGSPAIDSANTAAVPPDFADVDRDGDKTERTPLDIAGAVRFADDPAVADTGVSDGVYPMVDRGAHEGAAVVVTGGACCLPDTDGAGGAGPSCVEAAGAAECAALRYVCDVAAHLPPTFAGCYGDADGNGFVNPGDRGFIAANIEQTAYALLCQYDMDGNGFINAGDRGFVAANIGLCSPLPNYQNGSGLNAAGDAPDGRFADPDYEGQGSLCESSTCP